jgi:signal transduction histidine kinase
MKTLSLRVQVVVIVIILLVCMVSATMFIANAIEGARESIVRLSRERLSSLTEDLARRYGSVLGFIAEEQIGDTTLAMRQELTSQLVRITLEELAKAPDAEAGFFHSLWNREVGYATINLPSHLSYARLLGALQQTTIEEQREQWGHHESEQANYLIVTKPVTARGRVVGVAWAFDDLEDELAGSWTRDVTPLLQVVVLLGIFLAAFFLLSLRREVQIIQTGLQRMKGDLSARLGTSPSELGGIAASINELANTIQTQQREKEELLHTVQQKEKLASLGQLIAGVAHEIRTPLAAIKTRVQLWQRGVKTKKGRSRTSTSVTPESMNLVVRELDRMEKIVRKLLYFSKERKLRLQMVDLNSVVDEVLDTLQSELNARHIVVAKRSLGDRLSVQMDRTEMSEVFLNLILNSIESMPRGGTIRLSLDRQDDSATVVVEDTGGGIAQDVAARMFDPFFTTKETGTGLGLSIAYEIVRAHRGSLEYVPTNSRGARFRLTIPLTQDAISHQQKP